MLQSSGKGLCVPVSQTFDEGRGEIMGLPPPLLPSPGHPLVLLGAETSLGRDFVYSRRVRAKSSDKNSSFPPPVPTARLVSSTMP